MTPNFSTILPALGERAVAALLGRQVDDHRARLHGDDGAGRDELRRRLAGDQRRRDDDVAFLGVLREQRLLGREERLAHLLRVAALALAALLEVQFDELRAEALDLLARRGARVEGADLGAEALRRRDGREPGDAGADDEHPGRGDLAGGRHLARDEAAEVLGGLDDRAVAGDVRHRAERVHLLRARDARHAVHGEHGRLARGELLEQLLVLRGPDEADEHGALASAAAARRSPSPGSAMGGRTFRTMSEVAQTVAASVDDRGAALLVVGVGEAGAVAGAGLDLDLEPDLAESLDCAGRRGDATLVRVDLSGDSDDQGHVCSRRDDRRYRVGARGGTMIAGLMLNAFRHSQI